MCVLLCWCGSAYLIRASWIAFQENPINFGVETTYLNWNTEFPSVVICEAKSDERIGDLIEKHRPEFFDEDDEDRFERRFDLLTIYQEIAFFDGLPYTVQKECFDRQVYDEVMKCPKTDYFELANASPNTTAKEFSVQAAMRFSVPMGWRPIKLEYEIIGILSHLRKQSLLQHIEE
ncbi:hypothetical protein ANN_19464 [Periplaneta americana]|uniref:Uncharacterized protein n=1 Tax=Periplaneta americana TaxID=6978 RepID=A0ABQ8S9Z2_PERAM|nr:hypothetical protein ANN_19464 [Periplaneta americana]